MQAEDNWAQKNRVEKRNENYKNFNSILYYQSLLYILKIIRTKIINRYYNDSWVANFRIE